jgi:uncharacterized protein
MNEPVARPAFLDLSRGLSSGAWTAIGGGVLVFVVWQISVVAVLFLVPAAAALMLNGGSTQLAASEEAMGAFAIMFGGFLPGFVVLALWRANVEKRSVLSLFTALPRIRWTLVAAAGFVTALWGLGLGGVFEPDGWDPFLDRVAAFSWENWGVILVAYGLGVAVQATFEEVFTRGWLLQHLGRKLRNGLVCVLVSAVVFSAMHVGHAGWATFVATFALGLGYGWSALRLNGLEAAIGGHVANNFVAAALFGGLISGNDPTMTPAQMVMYALYVLGFVGFVEVWARFGPRPAA